MVQILALMAAALVLVGWRNGGPMLAMAITWLVCLLPVALGAVVYDYFIYASSEYAIIIGASLVAFALGTGAAATITRAPPVGLQLNHDWEGDLARWRPVARLCLPLALVSILLTLANMASMQVSLAELDVLREQTVTMENAGWFARLAALTAWACFFCFAFGQYFRHMLPPVETALFMATAAGVFLSTLLLAGRGSVFQFVLLTLMLETIRARRLSRTGRFGVRMIILVLGGLFIVYITMNRSTAILAGDERADILLRLFDASLAPMVENVLVGFGHSVRDFVVELLIYVSHPVPLFSVFNDIDFGPLAWGMHDFPFLFRQLQGVFGFDVMEAYRLKTYFLTTEGLIGVGWVTALSSLMLDFGTVGMLVFLFVQGFAGQWAWAQVRRGRGFGMVLFCVLLMIAAVYMPYMGAFGDTNVFLLLCFLGALKLFSQRDRRFRSHAAA